MDTDGVIIGTGGNVTVAVAVPFEQLTLNAQNCSAFTSAPPTGMVANCITAVSICGPVFAIMLAPAGSTQVMGVVLTDEVATNFTGVPGHVCMVNGAILNEGFGATTTVVVCGELQKAPDVAVIV